MKQTILWAAKSKFIAVILLFLSCNAWGQRTDNGTWAVPDTTWVNSSSLATTIPQPITRDTIPVIMLVSDTAGYARNKQEGISQAIDVEIKGNVLTRYAQPVQGGGFEVVTNHEGGCYYDQHTGQFKATYYQVHESWLDADRKPLKLYVWMSVRMGRK